MIHISLDRNAKESLSKQIYRFIKDAALQGTLQPEDKLPASRELAAYLNVSRNVVIEGYEQLIAEGYAYTRGGSGTYICEGIKLQRSRVLPKGRTNVFGQEEAFKKENVFGQEEVFGKAEGKDGSRIVSFRSGIPDLKSIPVKKWGAVYQKTVLDINPACMDYQNPFGDPGLRNQISLYLNKARGASTSPGNIMITNGAAQSFYLLCRLIPPASYALVENPLSYGVLHTLESCDVKLKTAKLDGCGMITEELPDASPTLIFTTPSHQFPTGVVMPARRRVDLIKYAEKHSAYIVEDDYDSEFRFDGSPIQAMQYLDPERVIYVGTFSKTLMPALRIGYMVLPSSLCGRMKEIKYVADIHSPILEQQALARFMETGLYELHIRKMRKLYLRKRNHLIHCLQSTFHDQVEISGAEAGLHFVAAFKGVSFDGNLLGEIENRGIEIAAVKKHYLSPGDVTPYDNALIMGYGNTDITDMEKGVSVLSSVIGKD